MFAGILATGIGLFSAAGAAHARPDIADLEAFVNRLTSDAVASRANFDETFGTELVDEGGSHFVRSRATDVVLGEIPFRKIELRTPRPGVSATAGPILILSVELEGDACIPLDDVLVAYPDLEWFGRASPHGMDPDDTMERRQGAARLLFSFPISGPDCLREMVYRFDEPL